MAVEQEEASLPVVPSAATNIDNCIKAYTHFKFCPGDDKGFLSMD